jgi:hypothetical protein
MPILYAVLDQIARKIRVKIRVLQLAGFQTKVRKDGWMNGRETPPFPPFLPLNL